jgi:hypothetical protein
VQIDAEKGFKIFRATNVRFVDSNITAKEGDALILHDAKVTGLDTDGRQR